MSLKSVRMFQWGILIFSKISKLCEYISILLTVINVDSLKYVSSDLSLFQSNKYLLHIYHVWGTGPMPGDV